MNLRNVITDADLAELQKRNASRLRRAIRGLGQSYLCHPNNRVQRKCNALSATPGRK